MKKKWIAIIMAVMMSAPVTSPAMMARAEESQHNSGLQEETLEEATEEVNEETTEVSDNSLIDIDAISGEQNIDMETMDDEASTMSVNEDKEDPVIEKVEMSVEPGTNLNVEDGGEITFKVMASDNMGLKETAKLCFRAEKTTEDEYNETKEIELKLQSDGIYYGSVAVADLHPCEWDIVDCHVEDSSGNYKFESYTDRDDKYSPYYVNIYQNGKCANVDKNVTIKFYNKKAYTLAYYEKDKAEKYLISTYTGDLPRRADLEKLTGDKYPKMEEDTELGEFKGWVRADFSDEETTMDLVPYYEKRYLRIHSYYLNENGWEDTYQYVVVDIGASKQEVCDVLPKMNNVEPYCHFQGWNCIYTKRDEGVSIYPDDYYIVEAEYDNYPMITRRTYIDKDGNAKCEEKENYYPQGTRYEDIWAELEKVPEDASEDYPITGWHMFDMDHVIPTEGTIGVIADERGILDKSYGGLVADYADKTIENLEYGYIDENRQPATKIENVVCDKDATIDEIKETAMNYAPQNHMKDLEFTGEWSIKREESTFYQNESYYYSLSPKYKKIAVIAELDDENYNMSYLVYAAEPGDTIKLPEGYRMTISNQETGEWWEVTEYTVPDDVEESVIVNWYWYTLSQPDNSQEIIDEIEDAEEGTIVEADLVNDTLSQKVLTVLQGKNIILSLSSDNGQKKWNIDGINIPEGTLADVNLSVTKQDKSSGNITESVIDELAGNRTAEQLVFGTNEDVTFKPQLVLAVGSDNTAEKGVLLQKSGDILMLAANSLIKDNAVTFTLNQKADSVIVYGTNGDIDGDNKVKIKDAMQILQHTNSRKAMNEVQRGFADTDSNNKVNLQDVMREMHYISGRNSVVY